MPAAISAPKATTRMTSVTGRDRTPAFPRSSSNAVSTALAALAYPNSPMKSCGCASCAAATWARTGSIFSAASSFAPRISNSTSAERPSAEI